MPTVAVEQALGESPGQRGRALLAIPEGQWFDRKSARVASRQLAEALVAFANAEGGTVVVGLHKNQVEGVEAVGAAKLSEWQQTALDFTQPAVRCSSKLFECRRADDSPDHLLVIEVEESQQVHATNKDEVFLRVGDETRKLNFDQRRELLYDKGQASFEATPLGEATFGGDLDSGLLTSYAEALNHPDPERLLHARGLLTRDGQVTTAAVLLFGAHPQQWLPEACVRVLRYRGAERGTGVRQNLIHDIRVEGSIPHQLSEARQVIFDLLPTRRALTENGRFEPVPLVPEDAWLEGLVNAVIHRSYNISGDHVRVDIFDDRIEIESPGRFPGLVHPRNPREVTRFARNPRIARVCADLRFGQELGEGIRRIFDEMNLAGLADPYYTQTSGSVRLTLSFQAIDRELEQRLPEGARDILRLIRDAERVSTGDVAEATGESRPVVLRHLRALRDEGLIDWVGQSPRDPRAYWKRRIE